ncbi:hypothetical protein ACT7CV_20870 [Bacillus paranthracis]
MVRMPLKIMRRRPKIMHTKKNYPQKGS